MAMVSYEFGFDAASEFAPNPNVQQPFGYITSLAAAAGPETPLQADLRVPTAWNGPSPSYPGVTITHGPSSPLSTVAVVGVIEKFAWNGGVGNPLTIDFLVSQENAQQLKLLQQQVITTIAVNNLGWWIGNYDQETKQWYEQSYPASQRTVNGVVQGNDRPELSVSLTATPVTGHGGPSVYAVSISVVPVAGVQYSLMFATSPTLRTVRPWGLAVGAT
jgi:hypothetical protein